MTAHEAEARRRDEERRALFDEVAQHCDVRERLALLPPSARMRGVYFRSIESALRPHGKLDRYRQLYPESFAAIPWYPESALIERLVVAGSLLRGPAEVHEGMREIGRHNVRSFSESLLGRTLFRLLSPDPRRLLQQGAASRRQTATHGRWVLTFPSERSALMFMREEFLYFDSYLLGAAEGTFDAIGVPVRIAVTVEDRFCGSHLLEW